MFLKYSKLWFVLICLIGTFISFIGYFVLPEKFFLDSNIIIKDRHNEIGLIGSYPFTIFFYKSTGLKHLHYSIIGIIQFSIVAIILSKIGIPEKFHKITIKNVLIYLSIFIVAIYMAMPTKEFINFIFIASIVLFFKRRKFNLKKTVIVSLFCILFFSFFFRPYYLMIVFISIFIFLVKYINISNRKFEILIYGLLTAVFFSLSYGAVKGSFISNDTRERINNFRIKANDKNANSMILSPVNTKSWYGESISIFYGFFSVNLPVNGIKYLFSPQIIMFVFWQTFLFLILYYRFGKSLKFEKNNYETWLFYYLFSFFIVQGVFEPDLGSAVRHKAGVFPLIYYLMYYENFRKTLR